MGSTGNTVEWEEKRQKARLNTEAKVCKHRGDANASQATIRDPKHCEGELSQPVESWYINYTKNTKLTDDHTRHVNESPRWTLGDPPKYVKRQPIYLNCWSEGRSTGARFIPVDPVDLQKESIGLWNDLGKYAERCESRSTRSWAWKFKGAYGISRSKAQASSLHAKLMFCVSYCIYYDFLAGMTTAIYIVPFSLLLLQSRFLRQDTPALRPKVICKFTAQTIVSGGMAFTEE